MVNIKSALNWLKTSRSGLIVALEILEEDTDGFFLMVEGSQIDWAGHDNDIDYLLGEMLAFDEAVEVVLNWINADQTRKQKTLLIVVADHETGGFMINEPYNPPDPISVAGDIVVDGWTSGDHTAVDTTIWSQGPCSAPLVKALDNTDPYGVMVEAFKNG